MIVDPTTVSAAGAWKVFSLFLIPIGGGIPAGVIIARKEHILWPAMMGLYFVSDIVLALLFEPIIRLARLLSMHSVGFARFCANFKNAMNSVTSQYTNRLGPIALIMLAFGADPMTGRTAALASGYGVAMGWMFAIIGDMFYFTLIMASTLWLDNVLGDGTWTTIIVLAVMLLVPVLLRRYREWKSSVRDGPK